jgi:hypothetical protein
MPDDGTPSPPAPPGPPAPPSPPPAPPSPPPGPPPNPYPVIPIPTPPTPAPDPIDDKPHVAIPAPPRKTDKIEPGETEPHVINPHEPQPDDKPLIPDNRPHNAKGAEVGDLIDPKGHCTSYNCHGFTFGGGILVIDEVDVKWILSGNYTPVTKGNAHICDVVVYGVAGKSYDHSGLVVEVDDKGNPKTIRSKWGPQGDVWDHPVDVKPYLKQDGSNEGDYETYNRNLDNLDKADRDEVDKLQKDYDKISDKSSREAHDAAAKLCQLKNRLKKK